MKIRSVTLLMIAAMFSSVLVFAQSPIAIKEESTVQVAPIVPTIDGFDTGITVVNTGSTPLTVTNFTFFSLQGNQAVGAEAAQADLINRKLAAFSFTVPGNGRFSRLASELLGLGVNGQLRFSVIGDGAKKSLSYQAILSPDFSADTILTQEITSRDRSPQN